MQSINLSEKNGTLFSHIKMTKEISTSGDIDIEKPKLCCYKSSAFLEDLEIDNILVANKISSGKKITINTLLVTYVMTVKLSH